jgi:hypothetical protein
MPAHAQTRHAAALEKMSTYGIEAIFGEVAKNEWFNAFTEWDKLGDHVFDSFNEVMRDGKLVRDKIKLNDACYPERLKTMPENQVYWTNRWADQMNFRYWRERSQAEMDNQAVLARQSFYEGTKAYKTGDFLVAAEKFKAGLDAWKKVMEQYPTYRDDELSKRETGHIVRRYVRVLKQSLIPIPDDLPFKDYQKLVEADPSVDPFDALEMLGPVGTEMGKTPAGGPSPGAAPTLAPANAPPSEVPTTPKN